MAKAKREKNKVMAQWARDEGKEEHLLFFDNEDLWSKNESGIRFSSERWYFEEKEVY